MEVRIPSGAGTTLIFNPMTSVSASLMMMDISTTTHSISCKTLIPIIQLYTITMMRMEAETTAEMMTMKATTTATMTIMN